MIWDTAGQERFHALGPLYYRDAQGALLVYDITDEMSFVRVRRWVKELRDMTTGLSLVIACNKADLQDKKAVNLEDAKEYADSVGAAHVLTSAKTGMGVDQLFLELTKTMLKTQGGPPKPPSGAIKIIEDASKQEKDKGCC